MIPVKMPAMPGKGPNSVANVLAQAGQAVERGQELFSIETSKRAVPVSAPAGGTVARVLASVGDVVETDDVLAEIAEATDVASPANARAQGGAHAELLVIGGGTGGYVAALYAAKHGMRVTLVERDKLGGTCLNRGCIPTKALIASAALHRDIRHAAEWGICVEGDVHPDMRAIIGRKNRVVDGLVGGVELLMVENGVQVIRGSARFEDAGTVVVDEAGEKRRLTFDACIVATGSTARRLDVPGAELAEVLDTDRALELEALPDSLAVVGGGVTGMEFAFLYADLGAQVTVIARRPRVLHAFDEAASGIVARSATERGIRIVTGGDVKRFDRLSDGRVRTAFEAAGEMHDIASTYVLVAGGRTPETRDLGLERAGIALDGRSRAIVVDERMRTNVEGVYAVGDVNGLVMLAHAASYQARIAVDDMMGRPSSFSRAIIPSVAYTDPEIATVGVRVDEAAGDGCAYTVGTFDFGHNGKALAENRASGSVSIVADAHGIVKGATIVGSHASDLIGYMGMAVSAGMSGEDVRRAVFAHPTMSEAIHEAACDLAFGALHE